MRVRTCLKMTPSLLVLPALFVLFVRIPPRSSPLVVFVIICSTNQGNASHVGEYKHQIRWPEPRILMNLEKYLHFPLLFVTEMKLRSTLQD